jgi:malate dehydrogenase (oxaloacetate-decarboxylating)
LSNPTERAEAHPRDLLTWTDGRALIATGSPFGAVTHAGRTVKVGQGNNVFIFPGVGLGVLVSEARGVTDTLFLAAARALAAEVTAEERAAGSLFPAIARLRTVTARVAAAVVRQARDEGIGRDLDDGEIPAAVASAMWEPNYPELDPV